MIKIENVEVVGFDAAIRGMRNPMNSWGKSDSHYGLSGDGFDYDPGYVIGEADHELMMKLARAGSEHSKYRRMIVVYVDVTAPLYWWKEMDTYKVGTVRNSCSTMHKIHEKEFTIEDFSCEHLVSNGVINENRKSNDWDAMGCLLHTIDVLNYFRLNYLSHKEKRMWYQLIQLLPSSYNQRATLELNYEVLASIYRQRKDHKLFEWHMFCDWIKRLPYSELIALEG